MEFWFVIIGIGLTIGLISVAAMRHQYAALWRSMAPRARLLRKGHGPRIRGGDSDGVPFLVQLAALGGVFWGLLTGFVVAPAGLIVALFLIASSPIVAFCVFLISLHGFVLAVRLCGVASASMQGNVNQILHVAGASLMHHLSLFAAALVASQLTWARMDILLLATPPAVVGALGAALLVAAAMRARRLQPQAGAGAR
jgi:hypothetical protein